MSKQNQKEISTLNHQFFIDIPNKLISSDIASFLGIHPKNIHNYIKSKLVTQLLDVKPYMPSPRDFLTLSQVENLFRIAPNQKYVDHLFRLIEDKVIPLFNQHDESKKEKTIMTNLITTNEPLTMSSLEIAEMCDKRHDAVMRDIKTMLEQLNIVDHTFVPLLNE